MKEDNIETKFTLDYSEPLLYLAIHNGHHVSDHIARKIGISEFDRLREEDPYTEKFILDKPNHIIQYTSRFEYDLNREKGIFYQKPSDCWGLPIYPFESLDDFEKHSAYEKYEIFYFELISAIYKFLQTYDRIIILDIHSYNHRRNGKLANFDDNSENPEIIIGTNHYQELGSSWKAIIDDFESVLKEQAFVGVFPNRSNSSPYLDVRQNVKFSGGYLSRFINQKFKGNVCCISIEFQKFWMNEWTGEVHDECLLLLKKIFDEAVERVLLKAVSK